MTAWFVFLRFLSESAIWFGLGGLILSVTFGISNPMAALPVLAVSACLGEILGKRKRPLRFLGLLPLVLLPFLCKRTGDYLLLLPNAAYVALGIWKDQLQPEQGEAASRFRMIALLSIIWGCMCFLLERNWCFICTMMGVVIYLFLCRMLRHYTEDNRGKAVVAAEMAFMILLCLVGVLLSTPAALQLGLRLGKLLGQWVLYPALLLFLYVLEAVVWLLSFIVPGTSGEIEFSGMQGLAQEAQEEFLPQVTGPNPVLQIIVRLVGAALFLLIAWFVLRYLRTGAGRLTEHLSSGEITNLPREPEQDVFAPPAFLDRSPEAGVRRAYGAYCRWVENDRSTIHPWHTTRTVNELADLSEDEAAKELRGLYLRARYRKESGLTREDARRASALVREITRSR